MKSIWVGKIVISNQVRIKLKIMSMDYVDKWRFKPRAAYQYVYDVENIARSLYCWRECKN